MNGAFMGGMAHEMAGSHSCAIGRVQCAVLCARTLGRHIEDFSEKG